MPNDSPGLVRRLRNCATPAAGIFLGLVLAAVGILFFGSDDLWPGTLLEFGPRWVFALPAVPLFLLAAWARSKRAAALTVVSLALIVGPLCGGVVSLRPLVAGPPDNNLRILTCNCGGRDFDRVRWRLAVAELDPDIICWQDVAAHKLPPLPDGWTTVMGPHGVAAASRFPIRKTGEFPFEGQGVYAGVLKVQVDEPRGPITVVSLHMPTPRNGLDAVLSKKFGGLKDLRAITADRDSASALATAWIGPQSGDLFVAGDFNMTTESTFFQRDWSGFDNAFGRAGNGWGHTFHTSRHGVRIDHILSTDNWRCRAAWVGMDVGSDHDPVVADFVRAEP